MPVAWPQPYNPTREQHIENVGKLLGVSMQPYPELCDIDAVEATLKAANLPVFVVGYNLERKMLKLKWAKYPDHQAMTTPEAGRIVSAVLESIRHSMSGVEAILCLATDDDIIGIADHYLDMTD